MNTNELYSLYKYLSNCLINNKNADYVPDENAVMRLYIQIIHGEAKRKDFLIHAIKDMMNYIKENNIKEVNSILMVKFNRIYGENKR